MRNQNNVVFRTGGDWDSTFLYNNGEEVFASHLFIELQAGRDEFDNPDRGGVHNGGELTAWVRLQEAPDDEIGIFPGRVTLEFPRHELVIENTHPGFAFEYTRVHFDQRDVTDQVIDLRVNIDSVRDECEAFITVYKDHFIAADEVATYTIL